MYDSKYVLMQPGHIANKLSSIIINSSSHAMQIMWTVCRSTCSGALCNTWQEITGVDHSCATKLMFNINLKSTRKNTALKETKGSIICHVRDPLRCGSVGAAWRSIPAPMWAMFSQKRHLMHGPTSSRIQCELLRFGWTPINTTSTTGTLLPER